MRPAFLILLGTWICLAQEQPAFRADVALVHIDAEVTDGTRIATGFHKEDFLITDNRVTQKIQFFAQDEESLDLILLFDVSGSMQPSVAKVAASAHTALAELRAGDRIAVMTFNSRSRLIADFTDDRDSVVRSVNSVVDGRFGGGTRILAAVDQAAEHFRGQPKTQRRRAVVIVTDDFGQRSRRPGTVIAKLWEADALLSGLIVRSAAGTAMATASAVMNPMVLAMHEGIGGVVEKTGGDVLKEDDPGETFREMMRRLRLRYSLYYAMPQGKPGEKREVKVELSKEALARVPHGRVRARKGYVLER
jgi:VWFA-related protein